MDENRTTLLTKTAEGIINNPTHHLRHLRNLPRQEDIVTFLVDRTRSLAWLETQLQSFAIPKLQEHMLLALRGLLAFGLMEHCLCQRHRVDYGVDERRGFRSRCAVPYRASDTPSDRAEYAQPDTLIMLTHLSYYCRGLSRAEVK